MDNRALNAVTVPEHYTLPRIDYICQHIKGSVFSCIEIKEGFMQRPVMEKDADKTAMSTPWGLYEFVRMPFGLKDAPPTFQRFVNQVFHGLRHVFVYIDDVIIYTDTYDQHLEILDQVFSRLSHFGLVINLQKSVLISVEYLGFELTSKGHRPLQSAWPKIEAYQPPKDKRGVQNFLGTMNYYRSHIPNLAQLV